jgi:hypothetical protein
VLKGSVAIFGRTGGMTGTKICVSPRTLDSIKECGIPASILAVSSLESL